MNVSKSIFGLSLIVCLVFGFTFGYCLQSGAFKHGESRVTANMYVTIEDNTGLHDLFVGNVITNLGENQTGLRCFDNATYVGVQWISLSNDASPVQTWTKLPNEATTLGAARATATVSAAWMNSGDYARNMTHKFTFTGSIQLQCVGAQWSGVASSDNNLYACAAFTQTTFETSWNLTITLVETYNGN